MNYSNRKECLILSKFVQIREDTIVNIEDIVAMEILRRPKSYSINIHTEERTIPSGETFANYEDAYDIVETIMLEASKQARKHMSWVGVESIGLWLREDAIRSMSYTAPIGTFDVTLGERTVQFYCMSTYKQTPKEVYDQFVQALKDDLVIKTIR